MSDNVGIAEFRFRPTRTGMRIDAFARNARGRKFLAGSSGVFDIPKEADERRRVFEAELNKLVAKHGRQSS